MAEESSLTVDDDTLGDVDLVKHQRLQGHDTALSLPDQWRGEMCRGGAGEVVSEATVKEELKRTTETAAGSASDALGSPDGLAV